MVERRVGSEDDGDVLVAADIGGRAISFLVDAVLVSVLAFIALGVLAVLHGPVVVVRWSGDLVDRLSVDRVRYLVDTAVVGFLSAVYFAGSWWRRGATVGQRLVGIRLHAAAGDRADRRVGGPLSGRAALVRWLALGVPLWLGAGVAGGNVRLALWLASWLWYVVVALTTVTGTPLQGVHDRLAGSVAVRSVRPLLPLPTTAATRLVAIGSDA
jgi:uncharacterized RDD family membrane protein YckC